MLRSALFCYVQRLIKKRKITHFKQVEKNGVFVSKRQAQDLVDPCIHERPGIVSITRILTLRLYSAEDRIIHRSHILPGILFNTMPKTLLPDRLNREQRPRKFFNEVVKVLVKDVRVRLIRK